MKVRAAALATMALAVMYGNSGPVTLAESAASGSAAATLRVVHSAHYQVSVAGRHWGHIRQVTVTVHAGAVTRRTGLTTTVNGSFVVGINGLGRCGVVSLTARDPAGHHQKLDVRKSQKPGCQEAPVAPVITILKGQALSLPKSPTASLTASPTVPPTPVTTVVVSGVTGEWKAYTSTRGAFTVEYPSSWVVTEDAGSNGEVITAFAGSDGNFDVTVAPGAPAADDNRIGNVYCHQITVAGLPAKQCLDTIAFMTSATLTSHDRTYTIAARVRGGDAKVYEHALETFRLTQ